MAIPVVGDGSFEAWRQRELPIWLCWDKGNAEDDDAKEVRDFDAESAAERFAESRHADCDYPEEQRICVKDTSGNVEVFTVYAEPRVTFKARREVTK